MENLKCELNSVLEPQILIYMPSKFRATLFFFLAKQSSFHQIFNNQIQESVLPKTTTSTIMRLCHISNVIEQ
jgi:hypothetical protein